MVQTTLTYLADMAERPAYYLYEPPPGVPWRNVRGDRRPVVVHDARALRPVPSLDREGFALAALETRVPDLYDVAGVRDTYYREVEQLVQGITGAVRVMAFDFNLRCTPRALRGEPGVQTPVKFTHNDYTERSGPQRVRDLLPAEAEGLLQHRFAVINVWKPISGPVRESPFAVCDAQTLPLDDLVPTDLKYRDRNGEVYSLRFNPAHRWFYFSHMRADEVMLLKCYDSDRCCARFTAHSAFDDPSSPPDAPPRESIEVRTLAFFGT